jgi:sulfhydrogenase subunit alpha
MAATADPAVLDRDGLEALVAALLAQGRTVVGPTVRDGAVVLAELTSAAQLPYGWGVTADAGRYRLVRRADGAAFAHSAGPQSWKNFLHPAHERLWSADAHTDADLLALAAPDRYAIEDGTPAVVRADGSRDGFPVQDFTAHVAESHLAHSTALHSRLDGRLHLTGPLARFTVNGRRLSPLAREAAVGAGLGDPHRGAVCRNPYRSSLVRAVEVVYAVGEALRLIAGYEPPDRPYTEVPPRAGTGHGVTEAPRGLLYHRYGIDAGGVVTDALLVPPTAQNQGAIEDDLLRLARRAVAGPQPAGDDELTALCERAIRNHDPCISCSTHFLDLTIVRTQAAASPETARETSGGCDG